MNPEFISLNNLLEPTSTVQKKYITNYKYNFKFEAATLGKLTLSLSLGAGGSCL
jgi:hypothetical protein